LTHQRNTIRHAFADLERIGSSKLRKARRPSRMKKQSNVVLTILREIISALLATRRREVTPLVEEHLTLQELRKIRLLTEADLAEAMDVTQMQVSEIESRSDMYISTVRRQVEAMGGKLKLVVSFPGEHPVALSGVGDGPAPHNGNLL
jgi:hypothetical protein